MTLTAPQPRVNTSSDKTIEGLHSLFSALLDSPLTGVAITLDSNQVTIRGPQTITDDINRILGSSNEIFKFQKYALVENTHEIVHQVIEMDLPPYAPAPFFSEESTRNFLSNFQMGNPLQLSEFEFDQENQMLRLKITPERVNARNLQMAQTQVDLLIDSLRNQLQKTSRSTLYQAFNNTPLIQVFNGWYRGDETLSDDHCASVFYSKIDNDGYPVIYFNAAILYQLLFPTFIVNKDPIASDETDEAKNYELAFDLRHFLLQLGQHFRENVVFKINEEENGTRTATPIFFDQLAAKASRPVWLRVLLDISASMENALPHYKERLKEMIQELRKQPDSQNIRIELVPFNTEIIGAKEFALRSPEIDSFINDLKAAGDTSLYSTVWKKLEDLDRRLDITKDYHISVVVFTDGLNNTAPEYAEKLQKLCNALPGKSYTPAIFTFGMGEKYDKEMMDTLVKATCAIHTEITDLSQQAFAPVLNVCARFTAARTLVSFLRKLGEETRFILFPQEVIARPELSIPVGGVFALNNKSFTIMPTSYQLPEANNPLLADVADATDKERASEIQEHEQQLAAPGMPVLPIPNRAILIGMLIFILAAIIQNFVTPQALTPPPPPGPSPH
jgi:hypothetical protein